MSDLVPWASDEQAKAISSSAEFGTETIKAATQAGKYVGSIVGSVPQDLIGVLGGDWLHEKRRRNLADLEAKTTAHLDSLAAERRSEPSPSVLLPLLTSAADESRDELQALWAALLANAMIDGGRKVRREFFDIVKTMEPQDALIFEAFCSALAEIQHRSVDGSELKDFVRANNAALVDDVNWQVSIDTLMQLRCLQRPNSAVFLSSFGRAFYRALIVD